MMFTKLKISCYFFIFLSASVYGQFAKLQIDINGLSFPDTDRITIQVFNASDTILNKLIEKLYEHDSMMLTQEHALPGQYKMCIFNATNPSKFKISNEITLKANQITSIYVNYYLDQEQFDVDSLNTSKKRWEWQLNSALMLKNNLKLPPSPIEMSYTMGIIGFRQVACSKHAGLYLGGGMEYSDYLFSKDTITTRVGPLTVTGKDYSYLNGDISIKLRISGKNQKNTRTPINGFYTDIALTYRLPLLFREVTYCGDHKKIYNSRLHQYTDLRTSVAVGVHGIALFCEYRLFDFIIGDYSEIPRFSGGLRIVFSSSKDYAPKPITSQQ